MAGKGDKRRPGKGYSANYKGSKIKGGSWVQDPETGKLIPRSEVVQKSYNAPSVMGDIVDFVSPVTKELITDRGQLRRHNKKHGITNSADYSPEFMLKRSQNRVNEATGNTPQARAERREMLNRELTKQGIR